MPTFMVEYTVEMFRSVEANTEEEVRQLMEREVDAPKWMRGSIRGMEITDIRKETK